jgi:peptidyl-prolyl cis-trans isomerase D
MLQFIRDKSQGLIAWIIIVGICIPFALWGVKSYLYGNSSGNVVVKVSGTKITQQELSSTYNQLSRQYKMQQGKNYTYSAQMAKQLKQRALNSLISSVVLTKAATSEGFHVDPAIVEAALANMPIFQVNGEFSQELFERALNAMLYTPEKFFEMLTDRILTNQIQAGFAETEFVLPDEVDQVYKLIKQQRKFNYLIIPFKQFLPTVKLPKDAAVQYYKANKNEFKIPEQVSIEYLELSTADLTKQLKPTASQLKQFYDDNISAYTKPKQVEIKSISIPVAMNAKQKEWDKAFKKINNIASQIKKGVDFDKLAKQYSASSKQKGYWTTLAKLTPELQQGLKNVKEKGEISIPIKTKAGYQIVQLVDIKPQQVISYDKVKSKVLLAYKQQNAERQFANFSDQLANITFEHPDSLKVAAQQLSLKINSTGLFSRTSDKKSITGNPAIIKAAFGDDVLQGNNSDIVNLNDNDVVVLRIKDHKSATVKSFKSLEKQINNKLQNKAAQDKAKTWGEKIIKLLKDGKPINNLLKQYKLSWQHSAYMARHSNSKKVDTAIVNAAFHIPRTAAKKDATANIILSSGNSAVINLLDVRDGDLKQQTTSQKNIFAKGYAKSLGALEYQFYVQGLMSKAKIKHYKQAQNDT